jgi:excinuclease ABC subunit A
MRRRAIRVQGARQNNLKGITVDIPIGAVTAVTGVAGAGKSSLAFDVLYAEGHRRYVETFSPYARQFLERLDRPAADAIEGVLPSVAIDRTAPVRTSRSTVGTMTSVADYLRALWARAAVLHCRGCGQAVERDTPSSIFTALTSRAKGRPVLLGFPAVVGKVSASALRDIFRAAGFRRVYEDGRAASLEEARLEHPDGVVSVVVDRITIEPEKRQRLVDSIEQALRYGKGKLECRVEGEAAPLRFSEQLHCARCDIAYADPSPATFSFNNPVGACDSCRGFGRTMGIDPHLVIPNPRLSVAEGCVKPFQSPAYQECQDDLLRFMKRKKLPAERPWCELDDATQKLIWDGEPGGREHWQSRWYGIGGFFEWLQSRSYRMHVRVLLSRYRHYVPCTTCGGARLKPEALLFKVNGKTLPEIEAAPLSEVDRFFREMRAADPPTELLLREIRGRVGFLTDVGLGYLTLARQSRTLSGGEAQRVTLATALGGSLVNTLYVLDEPSTGLHPRDAETLGGVLRQLAAAGNAIVAVEHDPAIIRAADHVIDLGPGPGRAGGEVVYAGPVAGLSKEPRSRTGDYLAGRLQMPAPREPRAPSREARLRVRHARENNLADLSVDIPLGVLVCVTGVSGSGKSTLVDQVLYRNLRRHFGQGESEPGRCESIEGAEQLTGLVYVDQSALGGSSRVNAATYLGALEPLRRAFASSEAAKRAELGPSAFSFNSSAGACGHCNGAGYEKVEMQFLPDAFVRCPACDGKRYRPEVLEVKHRGYDIAGVLDLPAEDVARLFADDRRVVAALQPLLDIGLGYLSLSQPAPTLSSGEAQRLKLAAYLAESTEMRGRLFLMDEPTSGLHPADVSLLLAGLQRLVDAGNSVLLVEHNMDVARAADWVIDLGPEGGDAGGRLVGEGTPAELARLDTPTGHALRTHGEPARRAAETPAPYDASDRPIRVLGARENNLRSVAVDVPRDKLVAVTGPSGSGKSTLAFDVLYAEGQRRFLDCLSTYVRQFIRPLARPDVDRVEAVPPTVALEQKLSRGSPMSTVGTQSEIYHYLRLLFASVGVAHCPECGTAGQVSNAGELAERIARDFPKGEIALFAPLVRKRKGLHKDVVAAARTRGVSEVRIDGAFYDSTKPPKLDRYQIHDVDAVIARTRARDDLRPHVARALELGAGALYANDRFYSTRRACPSCGTGLPVPDPRLFTWSQRFGACPGCDGHGISNHDEEGAEPMTCEACRGARLRPEALAVRIGEASIGDIASLTVARARRWLAELGGGFAPEVMERVLPELERRLQLLDELGLGYLSLARSADTLSTGEAQRIRVVAQLASNLRGVCYVLDEPTVGLHPRDGHALGLALHALRDRGNTVLVVEHDEAIIRGADHLIDLGPGAGPNGGRIVGNGTPEEVSRAPESLTGAWLRGAGERAPWPRRPLTGTERLTLRGARRHNLRDVTLDVTLARFVAVTGPSGSGKSTLVRDLLVRSLAASLGRRKLPADVARLDGVSQVHHVMEVDESPIGRTPRSVPATYVGIMDPIRELFAATPDARARGYKSGRFSFNVKGGRCERCEGQGRLRVTMSLLPEVYVPCESCEGRRYNADTQAVLYKGKSIAEVLAMSVDQARELFAAVPAVKRPLDFLAEIGLGYLQLGQPSPTLSGGEAQRIKVAAELASPRQARSLYVLDEPTTGLHMADVARLTGALQRLVDRGDTVVVIEHNLDLIAAADCVVDLGPGGGEAGGQLVAWGTPEEVAASPESATAPFLAERLGGAVKAKRPRRRESAVAS